MPSKKYTQEELDYAKALGKRINYVRKRRGMTLKDLSASMNKLRSITQLSFYERGVALPNPYVLLQLGEALNTKDGWLHAGKAKK